MMMMYRDDPSQADNDGMVMPPYSDRVNPFELDYHDDDDDEEEEEEYGFVSTTALRREDSRTITRLQKKVNILMCLVVGVVAIVLIRDLSPRSNNHTTTQQQSSPQNSPTATSIISLAQQQVQHFIDGNGLALNIHITHHGGTTVCREFGHAPGMSAPRFACLDPKPEDNATDFPDCYPWSHNDTASNIARVKQYFNFVSWEWMRAGRTIGLCRNYPTQLHETNFEDPHLVSIYVTRDPVDRTLAGSGFTNHKYPGLLTLDPNKPSNNSNREMWWNFARERQWTNNFALSYLSGPGCCQGNTTDPQYLEMATTLLQRFTFVLDIACLNEGMLELARILQINITTPKVTPRISEHKTPEEKIPFPDILAYMRERNKLDIEMHEFAKSRSLVDCSKN